MITILSKFPVFSRIYVIFVNFKDSSQPGKPDMKFPVFSRFPGRVGTLYVILCTTVAAFMNLSQNSCDINTKNTNFFFGTIQYNNLSYTYS